MVWQRQWLVGPTPVPRILSVGGTRPWTSTIVWVGTPKNPLAPTPSIVRAKIPTRAVIPNVGANNVAMMAVVEAVAPVLGPMSATMAFVFHPHVRLHATGRIVVQMAVVEAAAPVPLASVAATRVYVWTNAQRTVRASSAEATVVVEAAENVPGA